MKALFFFIISVGLLCKPELAYSNLQVYISSSPVVGALSYEQSLEAAIIDAQSPVHYVWDFGDNQVSFDPNPVHAYASPGEYRVWLNVMDADGQSANAIHWIQVRHDIFQADQQVAYRYLSAASANCLFWDQYRSQTLWIGSAGGLIQWDLADNYQCYYRNNLPTGTVQDICQMFDQSIWIATTNGLVQFKPLTHEWMTYHSHNSAITANNIQTLATSQDRKQLWIGTSGGGILCWNALEKYWREYSTQNTELPTNNIQDLILDNNDNLWVATHRGLFFLDITDNQWQFIQTNTSALPDNVINVLCHDHRNHIWAGTWNTGLVSFDPMNEQWKQYNLNNSPLTDNYVAHVISSPDGTIWSAASKQGLFQLNPDTHSWQSFQTIGESHTDDCFNTAIIADQNNLLVNVNDSLIKMDARANCLNQTRLIHRQLPDNSVSCLIHSDNDELWMGFHKKGLAKLSPSTHEWQYWHPMNSPLKSFDIQCLCEMSGGKLALGTGNGLALYNDNAGQWTFYQSDNSPLPHNTVVSLYYDANACLWIGTMNGLASFTPAVYQWKNFSITDRITALAQTIDGRIWAGTATNGVLVHDALNNSWTRFNQENSGIPGNYIQSITGGKDRKLWIGTMYNGFGSLDLDTHQYSHYNTTNTSLLSNTITVLEQSQSGVLWVGTNDTHLYRFHPLTHEWHTVALNQNVSDNTAIVDIAIQDEDDLWIGTQENGVWHISWPQSLEVPGSLIIIDNAKSQFTRNDRHLLLSNIYHTFLKKGFRHNDICLITPAQSIDINGDHCFDPVIDHHPDSTSIVHAISEWASERYQANKPLIVFMLGQWQLNPEKETPEYVISNNNPLSLSNLNDAINAYELHTGTQSIVILDGPDANISFKNLTTKGRIVIVSGFQDKMHQSIHTSFIPYFLKSVFAGDSFYESFIQAKNHTESWQHWHGRPIIDDNGDGISDATDGSFARQIKIKSSQANLPVAKFQSIQVSTKNTESLALTIIGSMPMAIVQATLFPVSSDTQALTPLSIVPLSNYRTVTYCGMIQDVPPGTYELAVMAQDYHGNLISSEPEIIQMGSHQTGSIRGAVHLMIGTHKIAFQGSHVSVCLQNTDFQSIVYPDGSFSLNQIPLGTYKMTIQSPEFQLSLFDTVHIQAGSIQQLTPVHLDLAKQWCSLDSDCNGRYGLRDVLHLLQQLTGTLEK